MKREVYRGPQWKTLAGRRMYEPIIDSARCAWNELELATVPGERRSALVYLDATELPVATRDADRAGLHVVPIEFDRYRGQLRCAVTTMPPRTWIDTYRAEDDDLMGSLLGYPQCCREAFAATWGAGKHSTETTWPTLEGDWRANGLLRQMGVRMTPWMPCSPTCAATIAAAKRYEKLARECDIDVGSIHLLLELETTYDARNRIAFIETPLFRFSSDADSGIRKLHRPGVRRPLDVAPAFVDNGFHNHADMREAHRSLLGSIGIVNGAVMDLGAGDGTLVSKIPGDGPRTGVEKEADVVARGRLRHPKLDLRVGLIQDTGLRGVDVAILSANRLLEMTTEDAVNVRSNLRMVRRVLAYAYEDNIKEHGGIVELIKKAGLRQASASAGSSRVQVIEVRV